MLVWKLYLYFWKLWLGLTRRRQSRAGSALFLRSLQPLKCSLLDCRCCNKRLIRRKLAKGKAASCCSQESVVFPNIEGPVRCRGCFIVAHLSPYKHFDRKANAKIVPSVRMTFSSSLLPSDVRNGPSAWCCRVWPSLCLTLLGILQADVSLQLNPALFLFASKYQGEKQAGCCHVGAAL